MSEFLTDDEIDEMYEDAGVGGYAEMQPAAMPVARAPMPPAPAPHEPVYPVYPLTGMGQAPAANAGGNMFTKQVGPLPVWGWGLIAAGVGVGGYFWWQNKGKSVSANASAAPAGTPALGGGGEDDSKWSPSRSRFGDQLKRYFSRKGMGDRCTVYTDADEAKRKLKHVSPLITIKIEGKYESDKDLEKLCRREGLNPTAHEDGTIGLYPIESKRGKEWEEYIDALRDEGQSV